MWEQKNQSSNISEENKEKSVICGLKKEETSTGEDSGFISEPLSGEIKIDDCELLEDEIKETNLNTLNKFNTDSGLIDEENISKEIKEEEMILDSGIVCEVSDKLSNLSIKNSYNNLGAVSKNSFKPNITISNVTEIKPQQQPVPSQQQPWEIFYQQNEEGDTHLHLAIIYGIKDAVIRLISLSPLPCLLDIQNDLFQAPLHLAVLTNQPYVVRKLLLAGAEATVRDRFGNSPLHLACINGDLDCVRALTLPISQAELIERPVIKTIHGNFGNICYPNLDQKNYDGEECVHLATLNNHIPVLRHLVHLGANINAREGKSGKTPLHLAIEEGKDKVVEFLLEECLDKLSLETVTYAGLTAYQLASLVENKKVIVHLMKRGAEPLSPPESDDESDFDDNMMDRFNNAAQNLYRPFNGANAINVS